jgi:16S rRNA (cytosine967-C5)-methyltransferase
VNHVEQLLNALRQATQPADAVLAAHFKAQRSLGPRERAAISEACFAVLRERNWLTHLAKDGPAHTDEPRSASTAPQADAQATNANAAATNAAATANAVASANTAAARTRRLALLALASTGGKTADATPEEAAWAQTALAAPQPANLNDPMRHNLPQWLAQRLHAQMGEAVWPLAQALLQPAPLDLRVNIAAAKRDKVAVQLADAGFDGEKTPYSPWGLRMAGKPKLTQHALYQTGQIEVQDEGSQLLALLVDPKRGDMVADFCAGAGGKTLAMAALMRGQGRLYAFDTSTHRLEGLPPRAQRAGVANLYPIAIAHEGDERLNALAGKMDRVLVDAPCTGLGTLRRSPDRKWRLSEDEAASYPALQARILAAAAKLVKPGGRLVYATCSLLREENEAVADAFTAQHAAMHEFELLPVADLLAKAKVAQALSLTQSLAVSSASAEKTSGNAEYSDSATQAISTVSEHQAESPYLRLWPHLHGTDGFFAAVWQRRV